VSLDLLGDLNWFAVIVAAALYFVLGGLWFSRAALGGIWLRSIGWEPKEGEGVSPALFAGSAASALVAAIAVGMLAEAAGAETIWDGIVLGLVVGAGIAGTVLLVTVLFEPRTTQKPAWFGASAGYHFVGLMIAAALLSVW
jgi:hypothetical protein